MRVTFCMMLQVQSRVCLSSPCFFAWRESSGCSLLYPTTSTITNSTTTTTTTIT